MHYLVQLEAQYHSALSVNALVVYITCIRYLRVGVPSLLLNRLHSLAPQVRDTLIEQSKSHIERSTIQLIINNHLPPASVCAELGDGKQVICY